MASSPTLAELHNDTKDTEAPMDQMTEGNLQHKFGESNHGQRLEINTEGDSESERRPCPNPRDSDTLTEAENVTEVERSLEVNVQANYCPEAVTQADHERVTQEECSSEENVQAESGSEIANQAECGPEVIVQADPVPEIVAQGGTELRTNALEGHSETNTQADTEPSFSVADKRQERLKRIYELRLRKVQRPFVLVFSL